MGSVAPMLSTRSPAELVRRGRLLAKAGAQGNAGAPLVWSTAGFGVLLDSKGATFDLAPGGLRISKISRPDADLYLMVGGPKAIFADRGGFERSSAALP